MNRFYIHILIFLGLIIISACQQTDQVALDIPTTYNFDNVNYQGQKDRIAMLQELAEYARSANSVNATPLSATAMSNIYQNTNNPFTDPNLNASTKQLKNKVFPNNGIQDLFERCFTLLAQVSQQTSVAAAPGQAGIATSLDGSKTYLLTSNGMELAQFIEKGIATACMYYQSTVVYLGPIKMNVDNKAITSGKGTAMEHHWDEAFGYFGAPTDFPSNINNLELWAGYSNKVSGQLGSNSRIMNAFLKGRAAISAKEYDVRDEQIDIVREEWEMILAAVAISYLNDAKKAQNDPALYYHYLTEAYAFIMGIKFGHLHTINDSTVDQLLRTLADSASPLQANFYATSIQDIDNTINSLSSAYTRLEDIKAIL